LLQGSTDNPLDELGRRQATLIAERMTQHLPIDAIISSPLQRALITAQTIGERLDHEPVIRPGLTEFDFGDYEDRPFSDLVAADPQLAARFMDPDDFDAGWPGGESRRAFHARIMDAFISILGEYRRHRVVVVAHGGVLGAFLATVQGLSPNDMAIYDIKNCSLTELHVSSTDTLIKLRNDIYHLEALGELEGSNDTKEPGP
jgi:broad specificity phosphatase PhoE